MGLVPIDVFLFLKEIFIIILKTMRHSATMPPTLPLSLCFRTIVSEIGNKAGAM